MVSAVAFQAAFSTATVSCFRKTWFGTIWLGYRGINAARPQSLPTELNMTKSPTRESPQANKEPPPRQRNIYDYDGEYEFPTVQHWTPDFAGRRDVRHSRASHDFDRSSTDREYAETRDRDFSANPSNDKAQSLGWKDILLSVYDNIGKDRIILVATGVTF
jgi:hypothetical protein